MSGVLFYCSCVGVDVLLCLLLCAVVVRLSLSIVFHVCPFSFVVLMLVVVGVLLKHVVCVLCLYLLLYCV